MGCVQSWTRKERNVKLPKVKKDDHSPRKVSHAREALQGVHEDFGIATLTPSNTSGLLGVAKVCVEGAELRKKGHYNVTLSLGLQVRDRIVVYM